MNNRKRIIKQDFEIYRNINRYRLHEDNLRWSILGSYAAFMAALFSVNNGETGRFVISNTLLSLSLLLVTTGYFWILAIQNWFYNLFKYFVDECEFRIINNLRLRTLQEYAAENGKMITPYHPAFIIPLFLLGWLSMIIGLNTLRTIPVINYQVIKLTSTSYGFEVGIIVLIVLSLLIHIFIFHQIIKNWNSFIYNRWIKKLTKIYGSPQLSMPVDREKTVERVKNPSGS